MNLVHVDRNRSALAAVIATGLALAVPSVSEAEIIYGLTTEDNIFSFDSSAPGKILGGSFVTALQPNERLVGIDFRPATNELFGVGSTSRIYSLNPNTGAVLTPPGPLGPFAPALNGTTFDIDFNPTVDRIRLISDADQNLRLNPNNGTVVDFDLATPGIQPDGTIKYGMGAQFGVDPNLVGAAYTNSFAGATTTTLYTIDAGLNTLNIQAPPNDGVQTVVGNLGIDVTGLLGFDISGTTGIAYVVYQNGINGYSEFGTVNLSSGAITPLGTIGSGLFVRDLSVVIPEPASLSALAIPCIALLIRRRRSA